MSNTELEPVGQELREARRMRTNRLDDSLYSKDLAPHYMQLAAKLAPSDLIPKHFRGKPQDLFICWAMGYQLGLTPEQSQQCIAVINGKPAMWGDDMLALVMAHKDFVDIEEHPIRSGSKDDMIIGYTCTVKRKGRADKESVFTLDMAKKAGLLAKGGVWTQYPERMLKLRARGFCLRDAFPDALKGIKPREEVEDYIDAEYTAVEKSGSRTEQLKQQITMEKNNAAKSQGLCAPSANLPIEQEVAQGEVHEEVDKIGEEETDVHSAIVRLITETGFTEERLAKALAYYEVTTLEELTPEQEVHFHSQLLKL